MRAGLGSDPIATVLKVKSGAALRMFRPVFRGLNAWSACRFAKMVLNIGVIPVTGIKDLFAQQAAMLLFSSAKRIRVTTRVTTGKTRPDKAKSPPRVIPGRACLCGHDSNSLHRSLLLGERRLSRVRCRAGNRPPHHFAATRPAL